MSEPFATRPDMPGYKLLPAQEGAGLLPWSWAEERLAASHNYWLSTTRPDGRPHATAVWAVWHEDLLYFSCAKSSRKARNLAAEPRCTVSTERADEAVILEGEAGWVEDAQTLGPVWSAYNQKYDWKMDGQPFVVLRPLVAFGFIEHADQFAGNATRWTFA